MLDYKDIITKHYALGMSGKAIAESLGVSVSGVNDFLRAFRNSPVLSYPLPEGITNYGIAALVYGEKQLAGGRDPSFEQPDYETVSKEMSSRKNCYPSNYPRLESSDYLGNNRQNQCGQMTNRSIICGSEVALFAVKKLASDAAVTSTRDSRRNPSLWLFLVG